MLKQTMILLGLTITAAFFLIGCGGNTSSVPTESINPNRAKGTGSVTLVSASSPAVIEVYDPEGLVSITVRDSAGGRLYLFAGKDFPRGATKVQVTLQNFGQVAWHWVSFVDMQWSVDSAWRIYPNGSIEKLY